MAKVSIKDRLITNTDDVKNKSSAGGTSFNYNLYYPRLILSEGVPAHISFLTDWLRIVPIAVHWADESFGWAFCEEKMYKEKCDLCIEAKKPKKKDASGGTKKKNFATDMALAFVYNHDVVGQTGEKEDGTVYEKEPICIAQVRKGKGGANFITLMEANNEHPDFMDPADFYEVDKNHELLRVRPDTLINNFLMFKETGGDRVWQYIQQGSGTDTVYVLNGGISDAKIKSNLGLKTAPVVPKEVRDHFNKQDVEKLFAHACVHFKNVREDDLGIKLPTAGDDNSKLRFSALEKVDASKKL